MSAGVSTFPLRFRQPHIRELVRVVAEREGISQNELLEQAAEHEVVARGALLAEELLASATRLGTMSAAAYQSLVEASLEEFARGESLPDPLRSRLITRHPDTDGGFGAVAAFGRAKPGVMAGPGWSDDQPGDQARIAANCGRLLVEIRAAAQARQTPTEDETKRWHTAIYEGCAVPAAVYVGNFRGDPHYRDLLDREVGVGPTLADGYPERMGVWAADVAVEVGVFFDRLQHAFAALDHHLALGARPNTVDLLHEAVALTAVVHGEWIRIHPFVNGNSRTARLLAACVSLRYGLPVYVALKPGPLMSPTPEQPRPPWAGPRTSPETTRSPSPYSPICSPWQSSLPEPHCGCRSHRTYGRPRLARFLQPSEAAEPILNGGVWIGQRRRRCSRRCTTDRTYSGTAKTKALSVPAVRAGNEVVRVVQ